MNCASLPEDATHWLFTIPAFLASKILFNSYILLSLSMLLFTLCLLTHLYSSGGIAWQNGRNRLGSLLIPGPRCLPIFGSLLTLSRDLARRPLASMSWRRANTQLMALSLGSTPLVVSSDPQTACEILTSPYFSNRPIKQSAKSLTFSRAIGFATNGSYWRLPRKIASAHLFSPKMVLAHESGRRIVSAAMLRNIAEEESLNGVVSLRQHRQFAALSNMMESAFRKRYDPVRDDDELQELRDMVAEGFELLRAFNWSDNLPWLSYFYDPVRVNERCLKLFPRVRRFVKRIIEEHRHKVSESGSVSDKAGFVDAPLSLDVKEKLEEDDIVAVLWNKSQEILPYLNGRPICLVGMMGSGKTTVGKILSKTLGYSFSDSDAIVEHDVGMPVADIFKLRGQEFFRVKESEALQKLSLTSKIVMSTGGGAVVLPVNWRYMQRGVTVWLDVPLEALARRIAAVGTDSRPLLHHESDDAYTRALRRLSTLMEERSEAYTNADAKVSVENIAAKTGQTDVCDLSPASIAIEALEQIQAFLKGENGAASIPK